MKTNYKCQVKTNNRMKGFWATKFEEYCKRTDLHGYKYIVMEDLSMVERICWTLTIIVSIGVATYFVVTAYKWYATNPIVTVIESTQGAIWDVPFPTVTICDLNLVSKKSAYNLSITMSLPGDITPENVLDSLRLAPLLHTPYAASSDQKEQLKQLQFALDHNNMSIKSLFEKISPVNTCNHLVERCMWKNAMLRCDKLFTPIFTLWSQCCTFNNFAVIPIKNKKSMSEQSPRRVASCGYQTALTVLLRIDPDDYFSAIVSSQGTLVIIDSAYNYPTQASPARIINPSTEVMIALSPERTYATSGIKLFSPEQRQCYYSDEFVKSEAIEMRWILYYNILRDFGGNEKSPCLTKEFHTDAVYAMSVKPIQLYLDGFKKYSLHNCMTTQRVRILNKTCGCIPFYFPAQNQRSCTFMDMDCLDKVYKMMKGELNSKKKVCLAECEHFDYLIEVAMGKLSKNVDVRGLPFFKDIQLTNRSLLNVFFNDLVSTRYRRDVYFNWQNILAAFGGLLGLMLGFTLISGFDLLLFVTIRVIYQSLVDQLPQRYRLRKIHGENIEVDSKKSVINMFNKSIKNKIIASDHHKWEGHNKVNNRVRY